MVSHDVSGRRWLWQGGVGVVVAGFAWVIALGAAGAAAGAQLQPGTGTVVGSVTDSANNAAVPNALVRVVGSGATARTGADGHYRLTGVPSGAQIVQVNRLGFAPASRSATIPAGGSVTVDFTVNATAVTLQMQVVQGTAIAAAAAREVGASIGLITPDSLEKAPITNLSEMLDSRIAGLTVEQNSGIVGTGSRITIRGVGSTTLSTEPLIVVDGIRSDNAVDGLNDIGGVGGQGISRFDDLDFESIENVEVLRGPAAAALYGTEAANGVLVITTKHGSVDSHSSWNFFATAGALRDQTNYPAQWGRPAAGGGTCPLIFEYAGACVGADGALGATPAFDTNMVNLFVPIIHGYDEGTGLSVGGGNQLTTYYVGANWDRQQGILAQNGDRWTHVTGAFTIKPISVVDLNFTAAYTQRRVDITQGDNSLEGPFANAMLASPFPSSPGFASGSTPDELAQIPTHENVDRLTVGGNGVWRMTPWLSAHGTVGMDYATIFDTEFESQFLVPFVEPTGLANDGNNDVFTYTGSASLEAKYRIPLGSQLKGTTAFGGEWVDETLHGLTGSGQGLLPGTNSLAGASSNFATTEVNTDIVNIGGYLQEQVAWRDLLYVTLAGRLDGNSAFGVNNSTAFYPSGSISYVVSDESFWPKNDVVSSLRFRIAGGQSGREPAFRLADGSFTSSAYLLNGAANQTGLVPNTLGNSNLKPERSTEYETGIDVGFDHERFTLTATAYDRTERDLIFAVPLDISVGTIGIAPPAENENLGQIDNRGLEAAVNGNIFTTRFVSFDLGITAAIERSKLVNQGTLPPTPISNGISGAVVQEDAAGQPIGEYYAIPYTYSDLNHDGIIEPNEITYGTKPVPVGEPGPRDEFSFSPTLRVLKYFRINALFDRRDGATVYDGGDAFRCGAFFVGQECNDPHATLKDQAAAVAFSSAAYGGPGTEYGYILNGSFWRLREVSLTIMAPDAWSRRYLGGRNVSLTLSGRNLATWTPYRGLDPEVSYSTFSNVSSPLPYITQQFYDQPLLREWIARFNISW